MMRAFLCLLSVVVAACGPVRAQSNGQFRFTLMDGRTFTRLLDPEWRPAFKGGMLYITPRDRLLAVDVAAVQPVTPDVITGMHQVKLLFRSHLGRGSQVFWVPDAYRDLEDAPRREGFLVIGPQTLIREGIYRVALE